MHHMKPLNLMHSQLNSSLQNNLCRTHDVWVCAPGGSTKKALDNFQGSCAEMSQCIEED